MTCPRCSGWLYRDEHGDAHCLNCGWVAVPDIALSVAATERVYEKRNGVRQRKREPRTPVAR